MVAKYHCRLIKHTRASVFWARGGIQSRIRQITSLGNERDEGLVEAGGVVSRIKDSSWEFRVPGSELCIAAG